ncbi:MAG: GMC family oxidoreductase [Woeseia sp.]
MANETAARFRTREPVDFAIVGSGSAGGIIAKELATAGFDVVLFEQGPYRRPEQFTHDELSVVYYNELLGGPPEVHQQTFRSDESKVATVLESHLPAEYAQTVGGGSVHFSGNFWRFRDIDFNERSVLGAISGTNFADWPISYDDIEPYYTRVEREIGVSGAPGPFDSPRSQPFPMPPVPIKSAGVLLERGAKKLGLHAQVEPLAILSRPFNGRPACINCGYCMGFGCEVGAKSSTLATMIPLAETSGHCELRSRCAVFRLQTDASGRVSEVLYYDSAGNEQSQKARAVIVCANGAETPRLLLNSANDSFPDGLANSSAFVGKNLMLNGHSVAEGLFEHPLNEYRGVQVTRIIHDFYESDSGRGFYGGGGIDARPLFAATPINFANFSIPPGAPRWGAEYKDMLASNFRHQMTIVGSTTSLAVDSNNISIDPTHRDPWGRPSIRMTYTDHPDDLAMCEFLQDRTMELFDAAGAIRSWRYPVHAQAGGAHLLGTCRMGDDPASSVVDRFHRTHDIPNLFLCDGSSFVTSGRGQPTMTIMALAFRAAEHIAAAAKANEI